MMMLLLAVLTCIAALSSAATGERIYTERDLKRYLFAEYDKSVRPVLEPTNTVTVRASITPLAIRQLDEKNQILVLETWMMLQWNDEFLQWNPARFNNITEIRLPNSLVWKPDLAVYTTSPADAMFPTADTRIIVFNNGSVMWVPYFTIKSRCPMMKWHDKDYLVCNIRVGSWTYSGPLLNPKLYTDEVDLSNFVDTNPDWKLVTVKSDREDKYYPCCPESYPYLDFNVTLKKRGPFHYMQNEA